MIAMIDNNCHGQYRASVLGSWRILHRRTNDPRVELFLADALGLAQAMFARRHGDQLLEDFAPDLFDSCTLQDAAGVDVHVAAHPIVGHAVGRNLDAWHRLEPEATAAPGGESDQVAA